MTNSRRSHAWIGSSVPITSVALLLGSLVAGGGLRAQELEPRSYSPSPIGMNFGGMTYVVSSGGVAVDPSLPLRNVDADIEGVLTAYAHTFALAGRTASFGLAVPFAWGHISGEIFEETREVRRQGFADSRLRLAINLLGGPAMTPREFAARKPERTLGASLTLVAPTGEYESRRLINLGSNRWAFKPELGVYQPLGRVALEASAGVWLYTDNHDFFDGQRRQQDPLATAQLHLSYTFRPRLWIAASGTWYGGGETTIEHEHRSDRQDNTRIGLTLSVPVSPGLSLKVGWADGATTRIGTDFSTFAVAWQYAWQSPTRGEGP